MLLLVETAAGYGLFKVRNSKLLSMEADELAAHFSTPTEAQKSVALHAFAKFKETKEALADVSALLESKMGKTLKSFLRKSIVKAGLSDPLIVCDKTLGTDIRRKFNIEVVYNANTNELIRGVRTQLQELVTGLSEQDWKQMSLSLSHSLNRFKLKFSPEKVDTMIIQAIGLLDDLDRELNNFAMRLKEWYGWHFPELSKIVTDNVMFAQTVKLIGFVTNTETTDLSDVLPEEIAAEVKQAAEITMGTEITQDDLNNIFELAERVIELTEYRSSLSEYLKYRMTAIAPNLTHMVGELIGARLISHSGSLMSLAKHPSSTVQILGAEKALFRALKTKTQTPKYGLIYHATLVGQSAPKFKGKISRVLAAKLSLCIRVDALGDQTGPSVAIDNRRYVEKKLEEFSSETVKGMSKSYSKPSIAKYEPKKSSFNAVGGSYDTSGDAVSAITNGTAKKRRQETTAPPVSNGTETPETTLPKPKKQKNKLAKE